MNLKLRHLLIAAALPLALSAQTTTTLFNENFAGGRTTLIEGTSAAWFSSAGSTTVAYENSTLTQNGNSRHLVGYFGSAGSPVTLAVGDTLSFTFTVSFNSPTAVANGFRFMLLDSTSVTEINGGTGLDIWHNNNRITADNGGAAGVHTGLTGYGAYLNLGVGAAGSSGARLLERTTTAGSPLTATSGTIAQLGTALATTAVTSNANYTGVLTLTRSSTTDLDLNFTFTGPGGINYSIAATDTSGATFSFDAVGFLNNSGATAFTLSQAKLDYTAAAIPEPSTYAALVGLAALGLVGWRRHSRRA